MSRAIALLEAFGPSAVPQSARRPVALNRRLADVVRLGRRSIVEAPAVLIHTEAVRSRSNARRRPTRLA